MHDKGIESTLLMYLRPNFVSCEKIDCLCLIFSSPVPGNVSNLTASPRFFSIQLTWNPPRELNGVIIGYKVTYMLNDNTVTINTRLVTRLNITSLTPNTTIFSVSVAASTTVGQSAINLGDISTLSQPGKVIYSINLDRLYITLV